MTMTRSRKPTAQNPDDLLAEFTDRLLDGKTADSASSADPELRGLEETVLRLNQAFPKGSLDASAARRLQMDFQARLRKDGRESQPAWRSLRSRQSRQRFALLLTVIAVIVVLLVITPLLPVDNGGILGTAGTQGQGIGLAIGLGALLLVFLWLARRK
jgi:hypothetical protein